MTPIVVAIVQRGAEAPGGTRAARSARGARPRLRSAARRATPFDPLAPPPHGGARRAARRGPPPRAHAPAPAAHAAPVEARRWSTGLAAFFVAASVVTASELPGRRRGHGRRLAHDAVRRERGRHGDRQVRDADKHEQPDADQAAPSRRRATPEADATATPETPTPTPTATPTPTPGRPEGAPRRRREPTAGALTGSRRPWPRTASPPRGSRGRRASRGSPPARARASSARRPPTCARDDDGQAGRARAPPPRGRRADRHRAGDDEGRGDEARPGALVPRRRPRARGAPRGVPAQARRAARRRARRCASTTCAR